MRGRSAPTGRMRAWWGPLTGRAGVGIVLAGAVLGALVTVLAGTGPGPVLSVFLVAGTLAAALTIQPRAVYRIIPVPALAYAGAAAVAGLISDRAAGTSHTALAVSAAQWIASGFLAMTAATILAIAVTGARWLRARSGPEGRGPVPPAPRGSHSRRAQPVPRSTAPRGPGTR